MSIKDKAIEKIAAQLTALVGEANFIIVSDSFTAGKYAVGKPTKTRASHKKHFNFKDTDLYTLIRGLAPGESITLAIPGVPVKNLQSVAAGVAMKAFGPGNAMTSRRPDGGVDVLRLT